MYNIFLEWALTQIILSLFNQGISHERLVYFQLWAVQDDTTSS